MKKYQNFVIGFGKAGKTLAGFLASHGESTGLAEKNNKRYGGTCINVACIPSKSLEYHARLAKETLTERSEQEVFYRNAIEEKRQLTSKLRQKNYDKVASKGVEILDGEVSFTGPHSLEIEYADGSREEIQAERIFINTGSESVIPNIKGLDHNPYVYTSETMMEVDKLPRHLIVIGGGYIGLEFASYYENFGSKVTIIQNTDAFIPREDEEISASVYESMTKRGIEIIKSANTTSITYDDYGAIVSYTTPDGNHELHGDAVLVAIGRRPNTASLHLEKAGIEVGKRGEIVVDEKLRTSVENVWAMGDVKGGLQFTYISLDDFRIVKSQLFGDGSRTTNNRGAIPYTVFIDPALSRVGMSEKEALEKGYEIRVAKLPTAAIPKAQIYKTPVGMLKAIIDKKTDLILGAHFYCPESQEMINLIKLAMDHNIKASELASSIYTHPTMSEALNDLLG